ncbi:MAG TPA: DPP IV N-terminal domain-containing protein [Gaiellaceae bacterium]|nr:DPP IV N-terminal domain-containing protein [Gaiellaceae bacterium]
MAARYAKALSLFPRGMAALVESPQARPNWLRDTDTFWYANTTSAGTEFVFVDAATRTKRPAFDHARLAAVLGELLESPLEAGALPLTITDLDASLLRGSALEQRVEVDLDTYEARILGPARADETPSPDGRWAVGSEDHNLYVRDLASDEVRQLTTDGVRGFDYGGLPEFAVLSLQENHGITLPPLVVWSPDSSRFVTHRLDQRRVGTMHLLRSTPADGGRPQAYSYRYALPGDPLEDLATSDYFVFDAASGEAVKAEHEPFLTPFIPAIGYGWVWWAGDGSKVYVISSDRGDRNVWLNELDPGSGELREILEERSETHVTFGPQHQFCEVRTLSTGEVLWWSQRSDWGHLWLHSPDGEWRALTSGEWQVRHVVSVDEAERRVVFTGAGRAPGSDPYIQEIYAVSLDGGEIEAITADGLDHDPAPSPTGRYFVDVTSRYDTPTVSVLRDRSGEVVLELERADASALYDAGWRPPERVVVKAADGVTDLYAHVYTPHDFDPEKSYPVVNEVYPGPQISTTAMRFPLSGGLMVADLTLAGYAALGFVGVAVDTRGTALRSKSFQDHTRLVRDGDNVDDLVAAIRQLAETRPWMDLERVGVYGHSAGAYMSTRALLTRPDFFAAAVSSSGDHDDRLNHAWWGEKFFGLVDEFDYVEHANATHAAKLEGKLLLMHGEMDDNAVPHGTMRLVDALLEADKDFDLVILPNADHSMSAHGTYFVRKRLDYFVRHLLGEEPPKGVVPA